MSIRLPSSKMTKNRQKNGSLNRFASQTVHFGLYHVLHILKAIVPADNLSYQKRSFEHPMRRQIFAYTVGRI